MTPIIAIRESHPYKDLRNPFTDWLHGAFRLATGEPNRASDLFRNAVVLDGERNSYVKADFRVAEEAAADATGAAPRRVWIVHEDGLGPRLDEFRYELPVFAPSGYIYAGIAVPEFVTGTPGVGSLLVEANGARYRTEALLNVDRYAATEFEAGYDTIIGKAIASAVIKVAAQIAAHQAAEEADNAILGALLKIGTTVIAAATTQADTRMWRALPKSIDIASMPWPQDDRIQITAGSGPIADIQLPSANFVIVAVKTVSTGAPAAVHVAAFGGNQLVASQAGDPAARTEVAFVDAFDAPTIRLAVMNSESGPEFVHAAVVKTTNGHNSLTTSEVSDATETNELVVAHSIAKQSSDSTDWWKHHVSVDRTLKGKGLRQLEFSQSINAGGFVRVVGEFFNSSSRKLSAMYRFTWLDARGQPIDTLLSGWQVVHALPGTHARIHGTAPRDDISDFHIELSSVSRALGQNEPVQSRPNTR